MALATFNVAPDAEGWKVDTNDGALHGITENIRTGRLSAVGMMTTKYPTAQSVAWVQGAGVQRGQCLDAQAADVEKRQHRRDHVVRRHALHGGSDPHVGQQVGLRVHRGLGPTRRTRGIDQQHRRCGLGRRRMGGPIAFLAQGIDQLLLRLKSIEK